MRVIKEKALKEAAKHSKKLFSLIDDAVDKVDLNEEDVMIYVEEICTTFGRYAGALLERQKEGTDDPKLLANLTERKVVEFFKIGVSLI